MSLRTDKTSGILTSVFGVMMCGFSAFCLLIVAGQLVVMSMMPATPQSSAFANNTLYPIHSV